MNNNETLTEIAKEASRYDLTALLEALFYYSTPDDARRWLTRCYFVLSRQDWPTGKADDRTTVLDALERVINALDDTTEIAEPPLTVVSPDSEYRTKYKQAQQTLAHYADEIEATKIKLKKADQRAGCLSDLYGFLYCMTIDRLTDTERQELTKFIREHGAKQAYHGA